MLSTRLPASHGAVRLLGVGVSGLDNPDLTQLSLFDDEAHSAQANLDQASDQIREKFGSASLGRASGLINRGKQTSKPNDTPPRH